MIEPADPDLRWLRTQIEDILAPKNTAKPKTTRMVAAVTSAFALLVFLTTLVLLFWTSGLSAG